jgi:DNA-binding winged helix-turn-helix (wHTH) protein
VAVPLTPKTFQILLVLVRHGKEIVTKDDLMKTVWPDTFVEEANLSRNIFMLRKALGETAQDHRYIVTVPGRGYRLAENVHCSLARNSPSPLPPTPGCRSTSRRPGRGSGSPWPP